MKRKSFSREQLLEAAARQLEKTLLAKHRLQEDPVPPGYFTALELAEEMNKDAWTLRKKLASAGAEFITLRRWNGHQLRPLKYFKIG